MPIPSPREARARRAAQRWAEVNEVHGCPVAVLERAAAEAAERLRRDLDARELHALLVDVVRAHAHAEEQRQAEEARRSSAEQERLAYLQRARERWAGESPLPPGRRRRKEQPT